MLLLASLPTPSAADPPVFEDEWGSPGTGPGQFAFPTRATVEDGQGVFVADSGNSRIQVFDASGIFLREWGSIGTGPGEFLGSIDLAFGTTSGLQPAIFAVDEGSARVQVFTTEGDFMTSWGEGVLQQPMGICYDPGDHEIYVADTGHDRIVKFDRSGTVLLVWGVSGIGPGEFDEPVSVDADFDRVYVTDRGNHRVQVFDEYGGYLLSWGTQGSGPGQFESPEGVALDCLGTVYVADTGNDRIQRFDASGNYVDEWNGSGSAAGPMDAPRDVVPQVFHGPVSKVPLPPEPVFVVDTGADRIQRFGGPCCPNLCGLLLSIHASSGGGPLLVTPAGNGPRLDEIGATVTVTIMDCCEMQGVPGFPFQDIWLGRIPDEQGLWCYGANRADGNTDGSGTTTISGPLAGGGSTQRGLCVYAAGIPGQDVLPFTMNSPDLTGDLTVNLGDVGDFATDFIDGDYDFRSDLVRDGVENLADVAVMVEHFGEVCP